MGGTVRGKVDAYINTGSTATSAQTIFKNIYDFCVAHPNMTQIARHGGSGGTASNVNYWDVANPFLANAWFVFRMNDATLENGSASGYAGTRTFPWYMYVQFLRGDVISNFTTAPASPSAFQGTTSQSGSAGIVAVQFAIPVGSIAGTSEVAWNGAGSLGTNTKGTPVWRTTAGTPTGFQGSFVFPRSNNTGGSFNTNRENCSVIYSSVTAAPTRMNILADDDSILFMTDPTDTLAWSINYFGLYTPRTGLTMNYPMVNLCNTLPFTVSPSVHGSTAGNVPQDGGIPMNAVSDGVRGVVTARYDEWQSSSSQPNAFSSVERYDEFNPLVASYESPTFYGWAGEIEFFKEMFDVSTNDGSIGRGRVYFGGPNIQTTKISVPWKADAASPPVGPIVPRNNFTRQGISFP